MILFWNDLESYFDAVLFSAFNLGVEQGSKWLLPYKALASGSFEVLDILI